MSLHLPSCTPRSPSNYRSRSTVEQRQAQDSAAQQNTPTSPYRFKPIISMFISVSTSTATLPSPLAVRGRISSEDPVRVAAAENTTTWLVFSLGIRRELICHRSMVVGRGQGASTERGFPLLGA